jgi:hypothetical protein
MFVAYDQRFDIIIIKLESNEDKTCFKTVSGNSLGVSGKCKVLLVQLLDLQHRFQLPSGEDCCQSLPRRSSLQRLIHSFSSANARKFIELNDKGDGPIEGLFNSLYINSRHHSLNIPPLQVSPIDQTIAAQVSEVRHNSVSNFFDP